MNTINRAKQLLIIINIIYLVLVSVPMESQAVQTSFLYDLSNFTGKIPYHWVNITIDQEKNEIFICDTSEKSVRIFNENGMEIYSFGDDSELGNITFYDLAIDREGNIFLLSWRSEKGKSKNEYEIIKCNFRGEVISRIGLEKLPPEFSGISPNRIIHRDGRFYLVDKNGMRVAVIGIDGDFVKGYDIASLLQFNEKKRAETGIAGFSVDKEGNILFTIPVVFQAFKLSPDGNITAFGQRGSAPGKFNIVGGITSDDKGYYYLTDTLRCVVMIFDKEFKFVKEFGYRGYMPGNLIAPMELEVDSHGRIYIAQGGRRGVSVFKVSYNN